MKYHNYNTKTGAWISLKSMECMVTKVQSVGVLLRYLCTCVRRLGVPFIALRGLGAVAIFIWKPRNFPVYERTGSHWTGSTRPQSGSDWRLSLN
jgi:hypothetical protein